MRELAAIQAQFTRLDNELRAMDASMQASVADLRTNHLLGKIDLAFLSAHRRYAFAMQRKAVELAEKMAAVKVQVDAARRRLAEASKQRKILEKLRERQHDRWRQEIDRKDADEMNEIGMQLSFIAEEDRNDALSKRNDDEAADETGADAADRSLA